MIIVVMEIRAAMLTCALSDIGLIVKGLIKDVLVANSLILFLLNAVMVPFMLKTMPLNVVILTTVIMIV